jgi:apolipoprotein N-acyltransferase
MVILNHKLDVLFKYKKNNLVPFGEFLPFESFFKKMGLKKITRGYNSFSSGSDRPLMILDKNFHYLKILPLICYEIIYIGNIKNKNHLPDLVINISEDGWFGNSTGPYQHFKKAIYRSIEEGVFIARSANNGISALINPKGQVLESVKLNDTGKIIHNIPIYSQETIFSKFGNIIYFFIILLYIFTIFLLKKTKKLK